MNKAIVLLGAGGHGLVVADALLQSGCRPLGVLDPGHPADSAWRLGLRVLGGDDYLQQHPATEIELANGLGFLPGRHRRRELFEIFSGRGYDFVQVVHPAAVIGSDVELAEGVQIMAGAVVNAGARIGVGSLINSRALVEHGVGIGAHCHIAPGAIVCGDCQLGEGCFIGAGAVVIQGRQLPAGTVVAAGSCCK